jgi:3-phosphoshikimate 1-carboxyvinyltransferase
MIRLEFPNKKLQASIPLAASKSESNRALIINALSPQPAQLQNLASARDTQTMIRLLASDDPTLDVLDAGTTMRFLTAFAAATQRDSIMTGTDRMKQRPIGILVDALRSLGAKIQYLEKEGYPPTHVEGGNPLQGGEINIRGDVSSQFISALLMIGPRIQGGLKLNLTGKIGSRPYIEMTRKLMQLFGVKSHWEGNSILVEEQSYQAIPYRIESDWSGASYWYSLAALSQSAELKLMGLRHLSTQGDAGIAKVMEHFGVTTSYEEDAVIIRKNGKITQEGFHQDFSDIPDMAQTVAVVAAALNVPVRMSGLESLRIKETDRIAALQAELAKFGVTMLEEDTPEEFVIRGNFQANAARIHTYEDHRMAMAFAPLAFRLPHLEIEDPEVVNKSYPEFWEHLTTLGAVIA